MALRSSIKKTSRQKVGPAHGHRRSQLNPTRSQRFLKCKVRVTAEGGAMWAYQSTKLLLELGGSTIKRVVYLVDDIRGHDCSVVEAATVKTLHRFLTARDRVELDVDVAVAVGVDCNMNNLAIFLVTFDFYLSLEFLDPVASPCLLLPSSYVSL